MASVLIIIPTYNEIENIASIIDAVLSLDDDYHVLVVDDGSPDGTAAVVKTKRSEYPQRLHLIERSGKLGLGTAYIEGFRYALAQGNDLIMEMDADFSNDPKDIPRLIEKCLSSDSIGMVVGSRYVRGGGFRNWSRYRLILSYGASLYTRLITGMRVQDPTAGFVVYKREVMQQMDLDKIEFVGYAFQIEMKYYVHSLGHEIAEIPIIFVDRVLGSSKMDMSIVQEGILGVLKMRLRRRSYLTA